MPSVITEEVLSKLLEHTATDRACLQVNLEPQKTLVTISGDRLVSSNLKITYSTVRNIHLNPQTNKWQGQAKRGDFVYRVEYVPNYNPTDHGHWKPINLEME